MNLLQAREVLSTVSAPDVPILLSGAPGVGKSEIVTEVARERGLTLLIEHPVIADPVDYRGLPRQVGGHAEWLPIGQLRRLAETDEPTLVLLDDVGQASASVQAALMQLVLARRIGDAAISPHVSFVLASNRPADRSGARPLLAALVNRLLVLPVEAVGSVWAEWALERPEIAPAVAAYARFRADLFATEVPLHHEPYCTPRSLAMAGRLIARGTAQEAVIAGAIGEASAVDLLHYCATTARLPPLPAMLGTGWKSKDPGLMHAALVLAARHADELTGEVIGWASRLPAEWGVAAVSAAVQCHRKIVIHHPAFAAWASANKEILL